MVYRLLLLMVMFTSSVLASIDLNELKSFKAEFNQKVTNESNKTIEYTGFVFIKSNGKVLWQYKMPVIKNVYLIDDLAIVDEPELEQAIYSKLDQGVNFIKLLKDAKKIDEDLYQSKLYDVNYFISIKDGKIDSLAYKDQIENSVSIKFLNVEQNTQIDEDIFQFLPPKHYDIIEK